MEPIKRGRVTWRPGTAWRGEPARSKCVDQRGMKHDISSEGKSLTRQPSRSMGLSLSDHGPFVASLAKEACRTIFGQNTASNTTAILPRFLVVVGLCSLSCAVQTKAISVPGMSFLRRAVTYSVVFCYGNVACQLMKGLLNPKLSEIPFLCCNTFRCIVRLWDRSSGSSSSDK